MLGFQLGSQLKICGENKKNVHSGWDEFIKQTTSTLKNLFHWVKEYKNMKIGHLWIKLLMLKNRSQPLTHTD